MPDREEEEEEEEEEERSFDLDLCFLDRCFFFFVFVVVLLASSSSPSISSIIELEPETGPELDLADKEGAPPNERLLVVLLVVLDIKSGAPPNKNDMCGSSAAVVQR